MNLETIRRSALRKLAFPIKRSSYPLISGDTYRALCDFDLSEPNIDIKRFLCENFKRSLKIFIGVNRIQFIANEIIDSDILFFNWILFVHNGDIESEPSYFEKLSTKVKFIYSVNWLGDNPKISAIPQGLENKSFLRNGVPKDFIKSLNSQKSWKSREFLFYCSFNEKTNVSQRDGLLDMFSKNGQIKVDRHFQLPSDYRKNVMNSKFIVSPPGNGSDCHRTWEAIYLGSIPIVLRNFWPFKGDNLPVLVINNWAEMIPKAMSYENNLQKLAPVDFLKRKYLDKYFETIG